MPKIDFVTVNSSGEGESNESIVADANSTGQKRNVSVYFNQYERGGVDETLEVAITQYNSHIITLNLDELWTYKKVYLFTNDVKNEPPLEPGKYIESPRIIEWDDTALTVNTSTGGTTKVQPGNFIVIWLFDGNKWSDIFGWTLKTGSHNVSVQ